MSTLTVASNGSKGKADCCGVMKHTKMKAESQGFFCEYRIKSSQRGRFSTVIREKNSKCRIKDYQYTYTGMITVVLLRETATHFGIWDFGERLWCYNYTAFLTMLKL